MLLREIGKAKAKVVWAFGLEPKHDTLSNFKPLDANAVVFPAG